MTCSDPVHSRATRILDRLIDLLDEERLTHLIDEPIDQALEDFRFPDAAEYSQELFHRTFAGFLQQLYGKALQPGRRISTSAALDEAISILEHDYRGMQASGYYGALLDAADPSQGGIQLVLARLAELVKNRRRQIYVRWVAARYIDPADWHTKCALAAMLIRQCQGWMPLELKRCPAEELADFIPELLQLHMGTEVSAALNSFEQIFPSI